MFSCTTNKKNQHLVNTLSLTNSQKLILKKQQKFWNRNLEILVSTEADGLGDTPINPIILLQVVLVEWRLKTKTAPGFAFMSRVYIWYLE